MIHYIETLDRSYNANVEIIYPKDVRDIQDIINKNSKVIAAGSKLSFVPNFFSNKSVTISLKNFRKILKIDYENDLLHVEAGITVREILNIIQEKKKTLKVLPGWPEVTVGGCIANNVHGKNPYNDGIFQEIVDEIEIITPGKKETIIANRVLNSELFFNTCGGYGLTGIIISAKLKLNSIKSNNFIKKKFFSNSPEDSLELLLKNKDSYCSYAWHDFSLTKKWGNGIINLYYEAENKNEKKNDLKINTNFDLLKYKQPFNFYNSFSIKILNRIYYFINSLDKKDIVDISALNFPMNTFPIYFWYFFNGSKGFIESQVIIPFDNFDNFNKKLKEMVFKKKISIFGNVMKIFNGKKTNLSFESEGVCINYEFLNHEKNNEFFGEFYEMVSQNKGITSLYKDSKINQADIKKQYGLRYENFIKFLKEIDPDKKLNSLFGEKIRL